MSPLPVWWTWPLDISPHAYRRMPVRGLVETDLRGMLADPVQIGPDACQGRYLVACRWLGRRWHVIVEPDHEARRIILVTAYAPDPP